MQLRSEVLKQRLQDLAQFELLFASTNITEFSERFGNETSGFIAYMGQNGAKKTSAAFNDFSFADQDSRSAPAKAAFIQLGHLIGSDKASAMMVGNKAFNFFNLSIDQIKIYFRNIAAKEATQQAKTKQNLVEALYSTVGEYAAAGVQLLTATEETQKKLLNSIRDLIAFQKLTLETELAQSLEQEQAKNVQVASKMALKKKYTFYTAMSTVAVTGLSVTTLSALMQFNPHFAMLVGLHFTPAVLASVAAAGLVMAAAAAYLMYRAYKLAAIPVIDATTATNSGYSKILTASILGSGFSLTALSALVQFSPSLMQFSPKFALLVGLHLSPAALIGIAALGVLLMSIGLYRICKGQAHAPAPEATKAAPAVTCKDRLSQYAISCRDYFFKKPAQSNDTNVTVDRTLDNTVKVK